MNRRDLNRILMLGTALAGGWPVWLRRAFGAESGRSCPLPSGQEGAVRWRRIVSAAYRRAQQGGKPLLAFVVPDTSDEQGRGFEKMWDRGRAFGELLNHGDDDALATLALAEIVCAPVSALQALAPSLTREPLMVLVETDVVPARVRALDVELPQPEPWDRPRLPEEGLQNYLDREHRTEDQTVGLRIAALSQLLHEGLRATPQMLLDRAAQAQSRLGSAGTIEVAADAGPAQLNRVSAILLASAVGLPERERQATIGRIADAARFVLCRRRVPGSRWSNASGCGDDPELEPGEKEAQADGPTVMFSCGMGHVPEKSRRFLDFLSRDATWRWPS
jgi:hypothetical protein